MMRHFLTYLLMKVGSYPLSFVPYSTIRGLGKGIGTLAFYLCRKYRKRTLNHLALAKTLKLTADEKKKIAKGAFQNLMITMMELARLSRRPEEFALIARAENAHVFEEVKKQKKGVVLLSAHQANWEIGTFDLVPGFSYVTIGRPLANPYVYRWVLKIRERKGNQIILPKNALKKGIQELEKGNCFACLGDQAKTSSNYHYPFFGTRAFTTVTPAVLAYKTDSPLCVVTKRREKNGHVHSYSELIWPDQSKPWKEDVKRMMDKTQELLETSIQNNPDQWLWQHRRWKQGRAEVKKRYRQDFLLIILPLESRDVFCHLETIRTLYPRAFVTLLTPKEYNVSDWKSVVYKDVSEVFIDDWSFQLVFDFTGSKSISRYYKKRGSFNVINLKDDPEKILTGMKK